MPEAVLGRTLRPPPGWPERSRYPLLFVWLASSSDIRNGDQRAPVVGGKREIGAAKIIFRTAECALSYQRVKLRINQVRNRTTNDGVWLCASVHRRAGTAPRPDARTGAGTVPKLPNPIRWPVSCRGSEIKGQSVVYLVENGTVAAALALADVVRPESKRAIDKLHELGVEVAMLTGDSEVVATAVAEELGIDQVFAEVLPEHKYRKVAELLDSFPAQPRTSHSSHSALPAARSVAQQCPTSGERTRGSPFCRQSRIAWGDQWRPPSRPSAPSSVMRWSSLRKRGNNSRTLAELGCDVRNGSKNRHRQARWRCRLFTRKQTSGRRSRMSAKCHERSWRFGATTNQCVP